MHVRSQKRKMSSSQFKSPSRVLGICLLSAIAGIVITYVLFGFGQPDASYGGYYRNLEVRNTNTSNHVPNVMRFKDYRERFWIPIEMMIEDVLNQDSSTRTSSTTTAATSSIDSSNHIDRSLNRSIWNDQELASNIRAGLCLFFLFVLGIFGRRRRMKTRFAVLRARSQDDTIAHGRHRIRLDKDEKKMGREDKYDGACSHTLCGCYPVDTLEGDVEENHDCMNSGFAKLSSWCCGGACRLWLQWFSLCALAQEAREARLLLPPKDQRVDYITHQPFAEYFEDVHFLRRTWKSKGERPSWKLHLSALSKLSRYILTTFITVTIVIIVTERFNPRAVFSWADACVLIMTFVQSFIVLGKCTGGGRPFLLL